MTELQPADVTVDVEVVHSAARGTVGARVIGTDRIELVHVRRGDRDAQDTAIRAPSDTAFDRNDRICTQTATLYALESFGFASVETNTMPAGRPACEVREIVSITDDDLIEILADERLAPPPPPIGNGDISRRETPPEQGDSRD